MGERQVGRTTTYHFTRTPLLAALALLLLGAVPTRAQQAPKQPPPATTPAPNATPAPPASKGDVKASDRAKADPAPAGRAVALPDQSAPAKPIKKIVPRAVVVAVANGDVALRAGDLRGAARNYTQAVIENPQEPMLRLAAGIALSENGMVTQAVDQFRMALRYAEDDVISALLLQGALVQMGAGSEAQEIYQDTYRRFSKPDGKGLDVSGSINRLNLAIRDFGPSPVYYLLLGDAYQLSQNFPEADRAYSKAHDLAPKWVKPVINLGLSRLLQGKTELAIATFQAALQLDPDNKQAQVWKATGQGQQYANARQYPRAIAALNNAQRIAPKDPTPSVFIAQIQTDNGNLSEAAGAYETALRITREGGLFAQRPILYRSLAETWLTAHRPEKAREVLLQALTDEPNSAPLWYRLLAQSHFEMSQEEQGQSMLKAALDSEPGPYPVDTLNAVGGYKGLMDTLKGRYEEELRAAASGFTTTVRPDSVKITATTPDNRVAALQVRPLVALAHIARYRGDFREEVRLRRQLTAIRTNPWDWYLMAETYDLRIVEPTSAREAYLRALEIHNQYGGLSEATTRFARERLKLLTSPAFKPE